VDTLVSCALRRSSNKLLAYAMLRLSSADNGGMDEGNGMKFEVSAAERLVLAKL